MFIVAGVNDAGGVNDEDDDAPEHPASAITKNAATTFFMMLGYTAETLSND
jgi:hypothetical protein